MAVREVKDDRIKHKKRGRRTKEIKGIKKQRKGGLMQQGDKGERIGGACVLLREERVLTHP